ncbi:hypothetical protein ARMSODRAFT_1006659 [Armillaria solidipes]|uniref:Uncharacterized protein n=1 Tax=Armillaria solidipes TaxID=1076256 RepID=A0A2H3B314_9AGAR|nr:hypothetical protein ARMSODRAFT_1006659 [Armillaria solidipes]
MPLVLYMLPLHRPLNVKDIRAAVISSASVKTDLRPGLGSKRTGTKKCPFAIQCGALYCILFVAFLGSICGPRLFQRKARINEESADRLTQATMKMKYTSLRVRYPTWAMINMKVSGSLGSDKRIPLSKIGPNDFEHYFADKKNAA